MDAAYTTKALPALPARIDATLPQRTVATDLPPTKTVTTMVAAHGANPHGANTPGERAAMAAAATLMGEGRRQVSREVKVEIDQVTRDFVYKTIDDEGDLISQFPNETVMKIRAYIATEHASPEEPSAVPDSDDEVQHVERRV